MEKTENNKYKIITITLILAIVAIILFVILPKILPATPEKIIEKIDFSNSAWIEKYVEKSVGIYGADFFQYTAYSYNIRSNKMIVTYASQKSVQEARDYYLALPGAVQTGRNNETSLNITAENNGQKFQVYNYFSQVSRVFELELTLETSNAEKVTSQLEKAFPAEEVANIREIKDLVAGEIFGGYVRYRYDNFDDFAYPYIPIYSRAYFYDGSVEDFDKTVSVLNEVYSNNKYDETQKTNYYKINGQIISVSYFVTDSNEKIVSISIQKENITD